MRRGFDELGGPRNCRRLAARRAFAEGRSGASKRSADRLSRSWLSGFRLPGFRLSGFWTKGACGLGWRPRRGPLGSGSRSDQAPAGVSSPLGSGARWDQAPAGVRRPLGSGGKHRPAAQAEGATRGARVRVEALTEPRRRLGFAGCCFGIDRARPGSYRSRAKIPRRNETLQGQYFRATYNLASERSRDPLNGPQHPGPAAWGPAPGCGRAANARPGA